MPRLSTKSHRTSSAAAEGPSDPGVRPGFRIPGLQVVQVPFNLVLAGAVEFLDSANQLISTAGNDVELIISQLAPAFTDFAADLLPVAFEPIAVHGTLLLCPV